MNRTKRILAFASVAAAGTVLAALVASGSMAELPPAVLTVAAVISASFYFTYTGREPDSPGHEPVGKKASPYRA